MTTIINFNILNFPGNKFDRKSVRDGRTDAGKDQPSQISRTIEVTPPGTLIRGSKLSAETTVKMQEKYSDPPEVLTCYPVKIEGYGMKAYAATSTFMPKGTRIDSYA
jgi:hypothetical protein